MSKHTPGLLNAKDYLVAANVDDPQSFKVICYTGTNNASRTPENAANARFIALAWNAFVKAAEIMNVDAVELAERMECGLIADAIECAGYCATTSDGIPKSSRDAGELVDIALKGLALRKAEAAQ